MDEFVVEQVLRTVERIPRGRVATYGDIAAAVGIGPRQVGAVMREYGSAVAWWRVTNHLGDLPRELLDEACSHWWDEGIGLKPNRRGCRIDLHRVEPGALSRHRRAKQ